MNKSELSERISEISKTIFSYCMSKTSTMEDAEDLSQEILYELVKSVESLRDDKAFYGFMWGVAGNVYRQWYRRKCRARTCELTDDIPFEEPCFEDDDSDIYLLRRELALLSEKYRRATILYYIEGLSCSEISSALDISESMVKYLLFKSRKILKEGMNMDRNLGQLSYNPKTLIPLYSGQGPNQFWDFMQSKIRQNIVSACYNDSLTVQQISLETGITLPYLEDEIKALEGKNIIVRDGLHYKSNVIVISSDCADEIERAVAKYHELISEKVEAFITGKLDEYKRIGFIGSDFSENTLRWQLAAVLFRLIMFVDSGNAVNAPKTGWGESAYLWCVERVNCKQMFTYCGLDGKRGDSVYFFDYLNGGKGDHHDFFGNQRYIDIFCDICRGGSKPLSEYDLEAVAEMIKKGYVIKDGDSFRACVPIYTHEQYKKIIGMAQEFVTAELAGIIRDIDKTVARILSSHTPKHLQNQVAGIASMDKFVNAVCIPASILIDRQVLRTSWNALEMPTTYAVVNG